MLMAILYEQVATSLLYLCKGKANPTIPPAMNCYLGCDTISSAALKYCGSDRSYIGATTANVDMKGRFVYTCFSNQFDWLINSIFTPVMMLLNSGGLYVGGAINAASLTNTGNITGALGTFQ